MHACMQCPAAVGCLPTAEVAVPFLLCSGDGAALGGGGVHHYCGPVQGERLQHAALPAGWTPRRL